MTSEEIIKILDTNYSSDKNFKFVAETHKYTYVDDVYTSVTTFLQRFHKPFKIDYWAEVKAAERGVTKDVILNEWKVTNVTSTTIGTAVHEYIENYFKIIKKILIYINKFNIIFANKLHKLTPVVFEQKIFSKKLKLAGTIDSIFIFEGKIYIVDLKTNKKLRSDAEQKFEKLLKPFNKFYKNELNEYSIQLSIYAYILAEVGIKIDDLFLVHIPAEGDSKIYRATDMRNILDEYFNGDYINGMNSTVDNSHS